MKDTQCLVVLVEFEYSCAPKCQHEPRWSIAIHRPLSVYFYIVKYMLVQGWSEPIGMSRGAHTADSFFMTCETFSEFEHLRRRGKERLAAREKENGRNRKSDLNVVKRVAINKDERMGPAFG